MGDDEGAMIPESAQTPAARYAALTKKAVEAWGVVVFDEQPTAEAESKPQRPIEL